MNRLNDPSEDEIDFTKLRYVLYARRSSEDQTKQVRSLDDQIKECRLFAKRNGLHVVGEALQEKKSAKRAGQRKVFDSMLDDIKTGKYDAILAWAPDRLSRNMLEGGRLINMLDEDELKDMKFVSHNFTNDASGKLTLGIMFSISKHFTDELSRKVSRGHKGNFSEGKSSGSPKWGYNRGEDGLYRPNEYFDLVQQAWSKRALGESYASVVEFLLESGFHRQTKGKRQKAAIKPTINGVGKVFRDPFYYGQLLQTKQTVDLREIYDFEPMIDEETYNQVQTISRSRTKDTFNKKRAAFYPLRGLVYCGVCNDTTYMKVGKNLPRHKKYHVLSYPCDNPRCTRTHKSVRAHYIFESIYERLDALELTDDAYERYSKKIDSYTDNKIISIKQDLASKRGALNHIKSEINTRGLGIIDLDKSSPIYDSNERRITELAHQQADLEQEIEKLREKVINPQQIKVSKENFLNLVKIASDKMRAGSPVEKDLLCRTLFLNLRIDNEKVASYQWREPFATLVKATEFNYGARERT